MHALQEKEHFWKLFCGDIMFEPRKNTCAPREESFLIPLKHIFVTRQTETNIWTSNKSTLSTTIDMSTVNDHILDPGLDSRYLQF